MSSLAVPRASSPRNFWFVAWCSWPCEDLGAVIQVGWSALTTPSACTYYRQISVESNLFFFQGLSIVYGLSMHLTSFLFELISSSVEFSAMG